MLNADNSVACTALKSNMLSSFEDYNRVIDTISEITKIPKLNFKLGGKSVFKIQSNVRVINVGMIMRSSVLSIW